MLKRALRLLRVYHHIKQVDLAKRLNISNSYLSEIESGKKSPTIDLVEKYSEVFSIPVSSIMLFSEKLNTNNRHGYNLRFSAAEKILRLLEWIEDSSNVGDHV